MTAGAVFVTMALAAGEPTSYAAGSPFGIDPIPHTIFTASAVAAVLVMQLGIIPNLPSGLACEIPPGEGPTYRCPPEEVNALDRWVAGNLSTEWTRASDFGLAFTVLASTGALFSEAFTDPEPGEVLLADMLIVSESFAVAGLLTFAMKILFRRPRPSHYTAGAEVLDPDAHLSFPSGHTSATTSIAIASAVTFWLRRPGEASSWAFLSAATALSLFTGWARIAAGRHFFTDVLGGLLVGAAAGIAVPLLVARPNGPLVPTTPRSAQATMMRLGGTF